MLHPCRTEEFMKPALDLAQAENKWVSLCCSFSSHAFWEMNILGLHLHSSHAFFSFIAFKIHILSAHTVLGNQTYDLSVASVVLYCLCYRNAVWNSVNSLLDTVENIFRLSITLPMEYSQAFSITNKCLKYKILMHKLWKFQHFT